MNESKPYDVVKDFEKALCEYTGAKFCVTTNSCTNAMLLILKFLKVETVEVPKHTYMSVPMSVVNAGGKVKFTDEPWLGLYQLEPYLVWDCARFLTSDMFFSGQYMCLSFHWNKHLAIGTGGAIIHDNDEADVRDDLISIRGEFHTRYATELIDWRGRVEHFSSMSDYVDALVNKLMPDWQIAPGISLEDKVPEDRMQFAEELGLRLASHSGTGSVLTADSDRFTDSGNPFSTPFL